MADLPVTNGKRAKLPPLSATTEAGDEGKPKKKVVKKKKKPTEASEDQPEGEKPKATPRKKKAASASSTAGDGGEATVPKKKKRVAKKTYGQEGDPSSARSGGTSQGEDVAGSKASLIKSPKGGTPRKKKVKKKVKKQTSETPKEGGDIFDSTLAEDLSAIQDDIVTEEREKDEDAEEEYSKQPYSTASAILRSQPTEKFYIETNSGFKGENKNRFVKRQAEEAAEKAIIREEPKQTTILFAIGTHKVLQTICLFCHGLLAGFAAWHIVMAYVLLNKGDLDFLEHYRPVALPVQCIFYILLVLCLISAMDRFDIANPRRGFLLKAFTLQNGAVSVLIYLAALVVSLSNGALEDKIHLREMKPVLWNNTETMGTDLETWRNLNTARNSLSIIGWFIIALTPVVDRLTDNLRSTDEEDLLGVDVETNKSVA